jgi:glycerophosphoryl diester phosphodiesterase
MLSRDKELVVIHDSTVDRTTDGTGKVADMPLAALRELDAGAHFGEAFRGGKNCLTLTEVFETVGGKMRINVELKNYAHPMDDLTRRVIALAERFQLEDSVLLSSFNPINLSKARRQNPKFAADACFPRAIGGCLAGWGACSPTTRCIRITKT